MHIRERHWLKSYIRTKCLVNSIAILVNANSTLTDLMHHMLIHTWERPHKCKLWYKHFMWLVISHSTCWCILGCILRNETSAISVINSVAMKVILKTTCQVTQKKQQTYAMYVANVLEMVLFSKTTFWYICEKVAQYWLLKIWKLYYWLLINHKWF